VIALALAFALPLALTSVDPETIPGEATTLARIAAPASARPAANRFELKLQPFLGLTGNSWGSLGEARFEHDFSFPLTVGAELSPFALASSGQGAGAMAQARVTAAFSTQYLAVGLGVGGQLQRFGRNGLSLAPTLRLGRRDGLSLFVEYAYSVAPNRYTGKRTVGFSNVMGTLRVPLTETLALQLDAGLNLQAWAFTTVGLRQRFSGDGGPGTLYVNAALGAAWVLDRGPCDYESAVPCGRSAMSFGPTIAFGFELRF
jgi:hypothetical protein